MKCYLRQYSSKLKGKQYKQIPWPKNYKILANPGLAQSGLEKKNTKLTWTSVADVQSVVYNITSDVFTIPYRAAFVDVI